VGRTFDFQALGLELPVRGGHVGHLEGDVVDPDVLLSGHTVDLEDGLVLPR
jgi:hypothetical protein